MRNHSETPEPDQGPRHQPSPTIRDRFVPQVFRDGARPLDVAQAAVLLGWTKDAVRAGCERGDLQYARDHLNASHPLLGRRDRRGEAEVLVTTLPCGDRLERTPVLMKSPSTRE